jgi:hypothetical protein
VEGKRGSECLLKSVSNIDFNPDTVGAEHWDNLIQDNLTRLRKIFKDNNFLYRDYQREKVCVFQL